jgi:filamentous hemagglutinin family protein
MVGLLILVLVQVSQAGTVTTDGTLGPRQSLTGPTYRITPDLGRQVGANLFHSLDKLNLETGETAEFSGPSSVSRVITRITGGPSNINGTLRCTIPNADFYLINNAGVVFGPDAAIDISGSFIVTTADHLRLTDGTKFTAAPSSQDPLLTTAAPAAFGFLGKPPATASITINGTKLSVPDQKVLTLVGGDIHLTGATIAVPQGRVNLISAASAGEVVLDAAAVLAPTADTSSFPALGTMDAVSSTVSVDGDRAGRISAQAGAFRLTDTSISSASSKGAGEGIDITAGSLLTLVRSSIESDTSGEGQSGPISIISTAMSLSDGAIVEAKTIAGGSSGPITIDTSNALLIDGVNKSTTCGIISLADDPATGDSGPMKIHAKGLTVAHGGVIQSITTGRGNAGDLSLLVDDAIVVDRSGSPGFTGIFSESRGVKSGTAGNLSIRATDLTVENGAYVAVSTFGLGAGGKLNVTLEGSLVVDGGPSKVLTFLAADSNSTAVGNGGDVLVRCGTAHLLNGGSVRASTYSSAKGGSVEIDV